MSQARAYLQLVAGALIPALLIAGGLLSTPAPHASSATGEEQAPARRGVLTPARTTTPVADRLSYQAALNIWDGATMVGDSGETGHWLAAGVLMSRGQYGAARGELQAVRDTVPADSPLALRAEMLLAGTSNGQKLIALAFDDFPFPNGSPQLLNELSRAQVRVTFFAIGHKVREYPDVVALALTLGHSIQNHTYHHVRLADLPAEKVREELNLCSQAIRDFTGVTPRYLRAPHAASNPTVDREARRCGLLCVDPVVTNVFDMTASSAVVYKRCLQRAKPGAILALHDGLPATREALPRVIAALKDKGYQFVTVDQLLESRASSQQAQGTAAQSTQPARWAPVAGAALGSPTLLDCWLRLVGKSCLTPFPTEGANDGV